MEVLILGAGTMGRGLARALAAKDCTIYLYDPNPAARTAATQALAAELEAQKCRWLEKLAVPPSCLAVIEAVPENLGLKKSVLAELAATLPEATVVATNTSALSVHALAAELPYRSRFLGWHFFNPPTHLPLVEVIPTSFTAPAVVEWSERFLTSVGKVPLRAPDLPGFIVNRIARPYYVEALRLVESGQTTPEVVDKLMEGLGFRMGPFRLMDLIGIDTNYAVTQAVWEGLGYPPRFRPSWLQAQKLAAGQLGRKTRQGFYTYGSPDS
ncbi:MAG: 3-hydroxyacyl-CoA dehydrogenase family protein [Bacteroidia bacterium]